MSPARSARAIGAAAACAAAAGFVGPTGAYACTPPGGGTCGGAIVTIATGSLSLSAPASLVLSGTLAPATSLSTTMSSIQVQDGRTPLSGWSLSAVTSGDLTSAGPVPHTLSLGRSIIGGPLTLTTGTISPGTGTSMLGVTSGTGGSLNPAEAVSIASAIAGFGGGTYTMAPTVRLTPPANTFAGTYTTTITVSVTG